MRRLEFAMIFAAMSAGCVAFCGPTHGTIDAGPPDLNCAPGTVAQIQAESGTGGTCCQAAVDCEAGNSANWACTPAHFCLQICTGSSDPTCVAPNVCDPFGLLCRSPVCGENSDCTNGDVCIGGACQPPVAASSVISCAVLPPTAVLNAGGTATFTVLSQDASGHDLDYSGSVTWTSSQAGVALTSFVDTPRTTLSAPVNLAAGLMTISAAIGGVTCTEASVSAYAAATAGMVRVVVVSNGATTSQADRSPIAGVSVVIDGSDPVVTDATGSAVFSDLPVVPHDVSAFINGYDYVTVLQTSATDILIPLKPAPIRGAFSGEVQSSDFANVDNAEGTLHFGFAGASFAGNLADIYTTRLLGPDTVAMTISLGTATSYGPFTVPEGYMLGLGPTMFGPGGVAGPNEFGGDYVIHPEPGNRVLWGLASNEIIGDFLQTVGPALNNDPNVPFFPVWEMSQMQALVSGDSAVSPTIKVAPGETELLSLDGGMPPLAFTAPIRLETTVNLAPLPPAIDRMVVMAGVEAYPQGFIPLGATMGLDQFGPDDSGGPDGLIDPQGGPESQLALNLTPRPVGFASAPWVFLSLAVPSTNIFPAEDVQVVAGKIDYAPSKVPWNDEANLSVDLTRPFLAPAENVSLSQSARTFTVSTVAGATFNRLDIGPDTARWSIYFPADVTTVTFPVPPAGMADRFPGFTAQSASEGVIHSFSLGYPPPGTSTPETYDGVWQFDGVDAIDLSLETDSFAAIWITQP